MLHPLFLLAVLAALLWWIVLLLPGRRWSTRERLREGRVGDESDLHDVTVLIPARDEALVVGRTLTALRRQGRGLEVVLVDDVSRDGTREAAERACPNGLRIVESAPLPPGWSGKLWALSQGLSLVDTRYVLLLDADIELDSGVVSALVRRAREEKRAIVSVMATLPAETWFQRLLLPPFVFFFKLLYPFSRAGSPRSKTAAAAGGCLLVERTALEEAGGFDAIKGELIDDCALARAVKSRGGRIWLGLSRGVRSLRQTGFKGTWETVTRTAFIQLRESYVLLLLAAALLVLAFWVPIGELFVPRAGARIAAGLAILAMCAAYVPLLRFYRLSPLWALTLPVAGTLYLAMTIGSAWRHLFGVRSRWKGRTYERKAES